MATFDELISSTTPVLVDFFATRCGPCQMMPPILRELKDEMGDRLCILKVDVDKNRSRAQKYGVRGVPMLVLFKEGEIVWKQSGVQPAAQLKDVAERFD